LLFSHQAPVSFAATLVISSRPDIAGPIGSDLGVDLFNATVNVSPTPDISQAYLNDQAKWTVFSGTLSTELTFADTNVLGQMLGDLYFESNEPDPSPKRGAARFDTTWPAAKAGPGPVGFPSPYDVPYVAIWPLATSTNSTQDRFSLMEEIGLLTPDSFRGSLIAPQTGAVQLALADVSVLDHQPQTAVAVFTLWAISNIAPSGATTETLLPGFVCVPGGFSRIPASWTGMPSASLGGKLSDLELGTWSVESVVSLIPANTVALAVRAWTGLGNSSPVLTTFTLEARIW